jgi:uncharacterized protein (DUF3820 family)
LTGIGLNQVGAIIDTEDSKITIPFGKYKDKPLGSVPVDYMQWMLRDFNFTERSMHIKEAIIRILDKLKVA